jgi:hypothetical protein
MFIDVQMAPGPLGAQIREQVHSAVGRSLSGIRGSVISVSVVLCHLAGAHRDGSCLAQVRIRLRGAGEVLVRQRHARLDTAFRRSLRSAARLARRRAGPQRRPLLRLSSLKRAPRRGAPAQLAW